MQLPRIIERHADEAAFLWDQRRRAVRSPVFDLPSLTLLDARLDAHLEGLVVAGEAGLRACQEAHRRRAGRPTDRGAELFAALFTAAEIGDTMSLAKLLVAAGQHPQGDQAVISALGWLSPPTARRVLGELLADECPPALRRLGIAGLAARRDDPGQWLSRALQSDDPGVRSRAFRAVGELGRRDLTGPLKSEVRARGEEADPWALWSLVLFGEESAVGPLFRVAEAQGPVAPRACALAVCAAPRSESLARLLELTRRGEWQSALAGAEALADPATLPWLVDAIESHPSIARRAAWVYTSIVGAVIEPPLFVRAAPEEPDDASLSRHVEDPFEDLPTPDPAAFRDHFRSIERRFSQGERHIGGRPVTPESLSALLRTAPQPTRAVAAQELARTAVTTALFPVLAPGFRQKGRLVSPDSTPELTGSRPAAAP